MAPMIDMVFLLLVFFMCVSSLANADRAVEVDLPESVASEVPEDLSDRGTVSVLRDGALYLGGGPVTMAELGERLAVTLQRHPELRIQVRADHDTPFRKIRSVLETCAEAGAHEVIYAAYQRD